MISILLSIIIVALVILIFVQANKLQPSNVNLKNSGNQGNSKNVKTPGNSSLNATGIQNNSISKLDSLYTNLINAKINATYASNTVDTIVEQHGSGIPISENDVLVFRKYMSEALRLVKLSNDQITELQSSKTERFTSAEENSIMSDLRIYQLQLKSITDTIDQIIITINKSRLDNKLYPLQQLPSSTFDENSLIVKIANVIRNPGNPGNASNTGTTGTNSGTIKPDNTTTVKNVNASIKNVIITKITPLPRLNVDYITARVSKIEFGSSECNKYATYMTTQFMPLADTYLKTLNIVGMSELDKIIKTTESQYSDVLDSMISLQNDIITYVGTYIDPLIDQYMGRIKQLIDSCKSMENELFVIYKEKYAIISSTCYATHKQNSINMANDIYQSVLVYYNNIDKMLSESAQYNQNADILSHGIDVQSIQSLSDKIAKNLGFSTDLYTKMVDYENKFKPLVDSYEEVNTIILNTSALIDKVPKFINDMQLYLDSVKMALKEAFDNLNIQIVKDANQVINQTELDMELSSAQMDTATMAITNIRNLYGQIYNLESMNQYYNILTTSYNNMQNNKDTMVSHYKYLNSLPSNEDSLILISNAQKYLTTTQAQVDTVSAYLTEGMNLIKATESLKLSMLNDLLTINNKIASIQAYHEQIKTLVNQVSGYRDVLHNMMAYPEKQSMTNWLDALKYSSLDDQARLSIMTILGNINVEDTNVLKMLENNQLVESATSRKTLDSTMMDINNTLDIFENASVEIHTYVDDIKQIIQLLEIIPKLTSIIASVDTVRQSSITLRNQTNVSYSTYDWSSINSTPTSSLLKQLDGYKDSVDVLYQNMVNIGTRQNAYIQNLLNIGKADVEFIDTSIVSLEDDLNQIDRLYAQASHIIDLESGYSAIILDSSKKVQSAVDLAIDRIYQLNDIIDQATMSARKKNVSQVHTYELQANDLANSIKSAYSFNLDSLNQSKDVINSYIRPIPSNVKTAYSSITNNMDTMLALIEYTNDLQTNWIQINKLANS